MAHFSPLPSGPIREVSGQVIAISGDDIDTDRIIPARFLKCISFDTLGNYVFADDRLEMAGRHPFDTEGYRNASLLIVNENFGCGSSREHAPQALMRWGIRALIGQSFAEIFYNNCLAVGLPCATAAEEEIRCLQVLALAGPAPYWRLDVVRQRLNLPQSSYHVYITEGSREMLTTGNWDMISQLLANSASFATTMSNLPYLQGFSIIQ